MILNSQLRRKTRKLRLYVILGILSIGFLVALVSNGRPGQNGYDEQVIQIEQTNNFFTSRKLLANENDTSLYPPDAFTEDQLKKGAVIFHVIGMIYMFIALAIVCDEFFVPCLGVIIERLKITEDVAGATFMAAGGSAPELFASLFGNFFAKSNVGIGTIVGSAVFNILFVIGMCALVSKTVLDLTWWPLFRDVTFYSVDLIFLIAFFYDGNIYWYESLILFFGYIAYVLFMKYNATIELKFKQCLKKRCGKVDTQERPERSLSMPILHAGGNRFRHGILDLIIHSQHHDLHEAKPHEKAVHLHALETLKVVIGVTTPAQANHNVDKDNNTLPSKTNGHITSKPEAQKALTNGTFEYRESDTTDPVIPITEDDGTSNGEHNVEELKEEEEPLDLSWPDEWRKRINYILVMPIVILLWITLPDVRRPEKKKWFVVTFCGSIFWIAIFSYLMLWWANTIGITIGIPDEVMGLTIIAAGTSIPDLITSVIVAKKGFGDMAVSSSVGSNIFDITVGLPIPWMLWMAVFQNSSVDVNSNGLLCSIFLLFVMLITVIITIAASKWKMSKVLGGVMLCLYVVFLVLSVLLEINIIKCPVD